MTWTFKPLTDDTRPHGGAALAAFPVRVQHLRGDLLQRWQVTQPQCPYVCVVEMGKGLKEVDCDPDGQVINLAAGKTAEQTITVSSNKVDSEMRLSGGAGSPPQLFEGPWEPYRLFNQFEVQPSSRPKNFMAVNSADCNKVWMEVISVGSDCSAEDWG